MRRLMWFTIGFAAACALGVWVLPVNWIIPIVLTAGFLAVIGRKLQLRPGAALLLGCYVGLIWYLGFQKFYLIPARNMDGITVDTTVTAVNYSYETDYGCAVDGEFVFDGKRYKARLYVNDTRELCPGDTLTGSFRLRYTAPGGMRDPTYHAGERILFLAYQRGEGEIRRGTEEKLAYLGAELARSISLRLSELFPEDVLPFTHALVLGDTSQLDYETDTALKLSGIRHVAAVSGLHVAMLYTLLRALTLNRRYLTALLGIPVLVLFCAAAGFSPSVTRAAIMVGLMMLSQMVNREYDASTALSLSVLVMLTVNPLVITSIGFQMSVTCVIGILLFNQRILDWLYQKLGKPKGKSLFQRLKRWFCSGVSVSLSATVLTTPISAYYFGTVSLIGVVSNLVTLWAVSLGFYGIAASCILSLLHINVGRAVAWLVSWVLRYVLQAARILSAVPMAAVYTRSVYVTAWLVFVYVLLLIFACTPKKRASVLGFCACAGLCACLLLSWTEHTFSDTHFTALDVGQGQCMILHHGGRTFLIDCGGSNDEIAANAAAETLLSRGINRVDAVILTHADRDHSGGLPYLLTRIDADMILYPATTHAGILEQMTNGCEAALMPVADSLLLEVGKANMQIFGPVYAAESNENSLSILFESENCAILVTGDRSATGELFLLEYPLTDVDLLIAGHHGSKYSTSQALLDRVQPEMVVISVGKHNSYGHPAEETLDRLKNFGCQIFRTDEHGTIIFRR